MDKNYKIDWEQYRQHSIVSIFAADLACPSHFSKPINEADDACKLGKESVYNVTLCYCYLLHVSLLPEEFLNLPKGLLSHCHCHKCQAAVVGPETEEFVKNN